MRKKFENLSIENVTLEQVKENCIKKGWLMSALGILVFCVLRLFKKPKDYHGICPYFEIGKSGDGVEMGFFFICGKNASEKIRNHEVGHIVQNALVGGVPTALYSLGSLFRYWKRAIFGAKTAYDSWWYERQATELGTAFVEKVKEENKKCKHANIKTIDCPDEGVCSRIICEDCGATLSEVYCKPEWNADKGLYICPVCGSEYHSWNE
jgi:hypothetical protein